MYDYGMSASCCLCTWQPLVKAMRVCAELCNSKLQWAVCSSQNYMPQSPVLAQLLSQWSRHTKASFQARQNPAHKVRLLFCLGNQAM